MNVPQPPVTVRPASSDDAERLALIWRESMDTLTRLDSRVQVAPDGTDRWREAFLIELRRADRHTIIALRGTHMVAAMTGAIVANAPGLLPERIGAVVMLIVEAHGQGGGIGTAMFTALSSWFAANAITVISVEVPTREPIAQAFWRALGASETAHKLSVRLRV